MLASTSLADFEEKILDNTISYALRYFKINYFKSYYFFSTFISINLAYFGIDLSLIKSTWKNIDCYIHQNKISDFRRSSDDFSIKNVQARLYNYEIASNEISAAFNKVSKHCVIEENLEFKNDPFFTEKYYYHLNW